MYSNVIIPELRKAYYNNESNALYRIDNEILIVPEYRNKDYSALYWVYVDGYIDQGVHVELNVNETSIDDIVYTGPVGIIENCNLTDNEILCNMRQFYNYEYLDQLNFRLSYQPDNVKIGSKPYSIDLVDGESNLRVIANVRDMVYNISIEAYDPNFYCNNDSFEMLIHEEPPLKISDIHVSNLTNLRCNIVVSDSIVKMLPDPNIVYNYTISYTNTGYYNKLENVITDSVGNIEINPEYRDKYYYVDVDVHLEGYDTQGERLRLNIQEEEIMALTNDISTIVVNDLSNVSHVERDIRQYFSSYYYSNYLEVFCNIVDEDNKYLLGSVDVVDDSNIEIMPNVRGKSYNIEIIVKDNNPLFDRINNNISIAVSEKYPVDFVESIIDEGGLVSILEGSNVKVDLEGNFKKNVPEYVLNYSVYVVEDINTGIYTTRDDIVYPNDYPHDTLYYYGGKRYDDYRSNVVYIENHSNLVVSPEFRGFHITILEWLLHWWIHLERMIIQKCVILERLRLERQIYHC